MAKYDSMTQRSEQTFAGRVIEWSVDHPGKAVSVFCAAIGLACFLGVYNLQKLANYRDSVREACRIQGGVYIDGACRKPADIIRPE